MQLSDTLIRRLTGSHSIETEEAMTVGDLKAMLSEYPDDLPIVATLESEEDKDGAEEARYVIGGVSLNVDMKNRHHLTLDLNRNPVPKAVSFE